MGKQRNREWASVWLRMWEIEFVYNFPISRYTNRNDGFVLYVYKWMNRWANQYRENIAIIDGVMLCLLSFGSEYFWSRKVCEIIVQAKNYFPICKCKFSCEHTFACKCWRACAFVRVCVCGWAIRCWMSVVLRSPCVCMCVQYI